MDSASTSEGEVAPVSGASPLVERAKEHLGRLDALLDVQLAQLAHTDADNPRWHQLRASWSAKSRLRAGLAALEPVPEAGAGPEADPHAAVRSLTACVQRWLNRVDPALGLVDDGAEIDDDNGRLFGTIRKAADMRRGALADLRDRVDTLPQGRLRRLLHVGPIWGLGVLEEIFTEGAADDHPLDVHIQPMLADAEAWCGPEGGCAAAVLGLARLAEAALLAAHVVPTLDAHALFSRYAGAPEALLLRNLRPDHVLAFDASIYPAAGAPALSVAEQQLDPEVFARAHRFFVGRAEGIARFGLTLPHRAYDALNIRIGAARMEHVAAVLDADRLGLLFERLGADPMARALLQAGAPAVVQLGDQLTDETKIFRILTAFEPAGHALGTLLKSVPGRRLLKLVESVGVEALQRQVRALGADGLTHLVACVGLAGCLILSTAHLPDERLERLREDLGRRSVRLTLQAAGGGDVARLLRRGLSAQQLQSIILGAEARSKGLGSQLIARLVALSASDDDLQEQVRLINRAMGWPSRPTPT